MGVIVLAVGALLGWLAVAFMHYSDSHDRQLARGVSVLDSVTLVCVLAHFTFLLWTFGHLRELQRAESDYRAAALAYNERAEKISADNAKIAASAGRIATETTKAARLNNDAAYQLRRAAEAVCTNLPIDGKVLPMRGVCEGGGSLHNTRAAQGVGRKARSPAPSCRACAPRADAKIVGRGRLRTQCRVHARLFS